MTDSSLSKYNPSELDSIYVARQPIFNRRLKIHGYELLFRSSLDNMYSHHDGDYASSKTITNSFFLMGIDTITSGKRAFINLTEKLLTSGIASILPNKQITIEILETVEPTDEVIEACKELKRMGFTLALDDFVFYEKFEPLFKYTDIIKVDVLETTLEKQKQIISIGKKENLRFLAEKVETQATLNQAMDLGYNFFQGYFFSKPVIIQGKDVPAYKVNLLRIIQEVNKGDVNFDSLEKIIKQDVSITYKLLKFINSASFGFHSKIHSIKQAIALLGTMEFKKWVSLIALSGMGDDKPEELIVISIIRAQFCEQIAMIIGMEENKSDLFLMGMFSMIDAFVDQPLKEVLKELPIANDTKRALLGEKNTYRLVYELMIAYERGNWNLCMEIASALDIQDNEIPKIFTRSVLWTNTSLDI